MKQIQRGWYIAGADVVHTCTRYYHVCFMWLSQSNEWWRCLLGYHRSGSSLVGEIFNNHPDVLYFFEPMVLFPEFQHNDFIPWRVRKLRNADVVLKRSAELLTQMHKCNWKQIADFNRNYVKNRWRTWPSFIGRSRALAAEAHCDRPVDNERIKFCQPQITSINEKRLNAICEQKSSHVIKTVRLHVTDLLPILKHGFKVKIIYLVRDPRGVIGSRQGLGIRATASNQVRDICNDMQTNWDHAKAANLPSDVLKVMRYEDFVADIKGQSKKMLEFVGLDFHPRVEKFIRDTAFGRQGNNKEGGFTTFRKNPSAHIYGWKKKLSPNEVYVIEKYCSSYIEAIGFTNTTKIRENIKLIDSNEWMKWNDCVRPDRKSMKGFTRKECERHFLWKASERYQCNDQLIKYLYEMNTFDKWGQMWYNIIAIPDVTKVTIYEISSRHFVISVDQENHQIIFHNHPSVRSFEIIESKHTYSL